MYAVAGFNLPVNISKKFLLSIVNVASAEDGASPLPHLPEPDFKSTYLSEKMPKVIKLDFVTIY